MGTEILALFNFEALFFCVFSSMSFSSISFSPMSFSPISFSSFFFVCVFLSSNIYV